MKFHRSSLGQVTLLILASLLPAARSLLADVSVVIESSRESSYFQFEKIKPPAINDSAASATWSIPRGKPDRNSASLAALHDGLIPENEDSPQQNFFFAPGSSHACIALDLGSPIDLSDVVAYSWHPGARSPQVYTLYGAVGEDPNFHWDHLEQDAAPTTAGWTRIAKVDSRTAKGSGGNTHLKSRILQGLSGDFVTFYWTLSLPRRRIH